MSFVPGWILLLLVALLSGQVSGLVEVAGKNPLDASVVAIVVGMVWRNLGVIPAVCAPGTKRFEKVLILGIVLLGASFDLRLVQSQGISVLLIILATISVGIATVYAVSKWMGLKGSLPTLLAVGTTICGGSAIAIVAPVLRARDEETSYAIGAIAVWGLFALLLYPYLAALASVSASDFGVFVGTAIHSTPQVVGAGFMYAEESGEIATAVKLVRNCFMLPMVFAIAVLVTRRQQPGKRVEQDSWKKAFPWFLFVYFIMAGLSSFGLFTPATAAKFKELGKFCILMGMAGVGFNSDFRAFSSVGWRPLFVTLVGTIAVAATSITLLWSR